MGSDMATNGSAAKVEILRRIRKATGASAAGSAAEVVRAEWAGLARGYQRAARLEQGAVIELLEERLKDYDARVFRVAESEVAATVASRLVARGKTKIVIPVGLPENWVPEGFGFVVDAGLTAAELDELEGVMTGSTVAIAETGTVVLQNVPGQGRRAATLVPDYHLCVVRVEDVVETVPQAMDRLGATAAVATTFVSGPSATADIEMTRIKGVHGPRSLDVILVG